MDGLNLASDTDPVEKIRLLEEEVCEPVLAFPCTVFDAGSAKLKAQLQEQSLSGPSSGPSTSHQHSYGLFRPESTHSSSASGSQLSATTGHHPLHHNIGNPSSLAHLHFLQGSLGTNNTAHRYPTDDDLELIHTGWNTDLPEPHVLDH